MDVAGLFQNPIIGWFILGLVLFLVELSAPGMIVFFFGVAAWVVMTLCFFVNLSLNLQLILFIVISITSLLLLRKWLSSILKGFVRARQDPTQQLDEFIGKKVVVKEEIAPNRAGKIELNGTLWQAESSQTIPVGTTVMIVKKDNITFEVKTL